MRVTKYGHLHPMYRVVSLVLVLTLLAGFGGTMMIRAQGNDDTLQAQYDANEQAIAAMLANMDKRMADMKVLDEAGTLPKIDLLGLSLGTYSLLEGMVKGTKVGVPYTDLTLYQIKGKQAQEYFSNYSSTVVIGKALGVIELTKDLNFPNGLFNGSAVVSGSSIEAQPLEAKIAAQEYALYIGQAVESMLTLVSLLDTDNFDISKLTGARAFLEFNADTLDSKKNDVLSKLTNKNSVTLSQNYIITTYKRTVNMTDIFNENLGMGYEYLTAVRDILLPILGDANAVLNILDAMAVFMSDDFLKKYETGSIGDILAYLDADLAAVESLLQNVQKLNPVILDLGLSFVKNIVKELIPQLSGEALGMLGGYLDQLGIPALQDLVNDFLSGEADKLTALLNTYIDGITIDNILNVVQTARAIVADAAEIYNKVTAIVDKVTSTYEAFEKLVRFVKENATQENLDEVLAWAQDVRDAYKAELMTRVSDIIADAKECIGGAKSGLNAYLEKLSLWCASFKEKAEALCGELDDKWDAVLAQIHNIEPLTILATPGAGDVFYTLSTNYDCLTGFVQNKLEKCTGQPWNCLEFVIDDNTNFVLDGNNLKAKGTLDNKEYTVNVTYRLNINIKGHRLIVNLAHKRLIINNYTEPVPVINTLELKTNFIVSRYNAYINITAKGENLDGHALTVKLFDRTITLTDGYARVYLTKEEIPDVSETTYYDVVAFIDGTYAAIAEMKVKPYIDDLWTVSLVPVLDGKMEIRFAEEVAPKTNCDFIVTITGQGDKQVTQSAEDPRVLIIDHVPAIGEEFIIRNVKFPDSFPSYAFIFTVVYGAE